MKYEADVNHPDLLLGGTGFIFASILLVAIVRDSLPSGAIEFLPSMGMALIPAACGIDEIIRYFTR